MKTVLCSLVAICALMMVLASSVFAAQPTTPRASEYIEVFCDGHFFNRPASTSFEGQTKAQASYNLHHEEQCVVVVP